MKCPKCHYEHNSEDALYCGLCYELLKKTEKASPAAVQAAAGPARGGAGTILQVALVTGLLSGAGVYFYGASGTAAGRQASALEEVRFREKTQAAESLLLAYNKGREELLTEIVKTELDPEGFGLQGQYTKKLFKLDEDYSDGMNAAQLACPAGADGSGGEAYKKWCEGFAAQENAAMEDFNRKYRQLVQKAGVQ